MLENQLKQIPSVSEIIQELPIECSIPRPYAIALIQKHLVKFRNLAQQQQLDSIRSEIVRNIITAVLAHQQPNLKNVINGTGVVLHTGLGRAPIGHTVLESVLKRLTGYVNLEFDLPSGNRGERIDHVAPLLSALVGAEDSLVVNNNAAAVLLTLNSLAEGREVIVSRGQEVEIGGSFRIPDVIIKSNCTMVEVGTTNRTHLKDYTGAINENTAVLLWAHTSNYVVKGFTAEVSLDELVKLGKKHGIPVIADLGSGALLDLQTSGLPAELQVSEVLNKGVDIVTFSGDKLLGGPQAGLITGSKNILDKIHANPIYRAVRCDKFILALLEETLRTYDGNAVNDNNLTHALLSTPPEILMKRGQEILNTLPEETLKVLGIVLMPSQVEAGSGSLPVADIPSAALCFNPKNLKVTELARRFRTGSEPVIGYIRNQKFHIDLKAIVPDQLPRLVAAIKNI
ncbi:MAG: L-seryl-tRNA(Sec) selenium transferase [Candidatus Marinimicrobia bacterium]|nr:L-seryl-tRNA(Sec) selenium transferase [Candidatus Neomarinimicrobiota bacterium]